MTNKKKKINSSREPSSSSKVKGGTPWTIDRIGILISVFISFYSLFVSIHTKNIETSSNPITIRKIEFVDIDYFKAFNPFNKGYDGEPYKLFRTVNDSSKTDHKHEDKPYNTRKKLKIDFSSGNLSKTEFFMKVDSDNSEEIHWQNIESPFFEGEKDENNGIGIPIDSDRHEAYVGGSAYLEPVPKTPGFQSVEFFTLFYDYAGNKELVGIKIYLENKVLANDKNEENDKNKVSVIFIDESSWIDKSDEAKNDYIKYPRYKDFLENYNELKGLLEGKGVI